jgi:predicted permease
MAATGMISGLPPPAPPGEVDRPRLLLLTMLIDSLAPCAINGVLICTMFGYGAAPYSKMLAVMYIVSVATSVFWLIVILTVLA